MKRNFLLNGKHYAALAAIGLGLSLSLTNCDNVSMSDIQKLENLGKMAESLAQPKDQWHSLVNEKTASVQVEGNTLTYGSHTYTVNGDIDFKSNEHRTPTATVSFTNIPSGYTEFEAVYNGLLGKTPQGAAAMVPMAIEIYARDAATGEKCFNLLCNSDATVANIVRILKTKLVPSEYGPENDSYLQRYMAAALLKGAVNTNAYAPEQPYTVELCSSPNGIQDSPLMGGTTYYLYILAHGWDSEQRAVDIFQPGGSATYKVSNCPSTYTQCKNIQGTWAGLK